MPPPTRPEVKELPAKRGNGNQEKARQMAAKGVTTAEIAKTLGIKYATVYSYLHPEKKKKASAKQPAMKPGWNKDRHACKSCQYRAEGHKGCDYYMLTDKERGGDPADCDKYVKGDRLKKK